MAKRSVPEGLLDDQDPYVAAAKANLRKFKSLHTKYYLKIAEEILTLRYHVGDQLATTGMEVLLRTELGFTASEAKTFTSFDKGLATSALLMSRAISPAVIAAIAEADEKTRDESLRHIERGEAVELDWVQSCTRSNAIAAMPPDSLAELRRSELFREASSDFAADKLFQVESCAADLLDLIEIAEEAGLDSSYSYSPVGDADKTFPINKRAGEIISHLDDLFGGRPRVYDRPVDADMFSYQPSPKHVALASASFSYKSLRDLHQGTLSPTDVIIDEWFKPRRCLAFLAGRRPSAVPDRTAQGLPWSPASPPCFVDIDAGAGGATLGLVAAGMFPLRVLARTSHELRAIKSNPMMNVQQHDEDFGAQLLEIEGEQIDLLTSGIPWHHYEVPEAREAYRQALDAVSILKPKAFLFETLSQAKDGYKAQDFIGLGYDVRWHTLDSADYGLVQAKKREIVVGALRGESIVDRVAMPVLQARPQVLASAIGDLVAGHVWKGRVSKKKKDTHRALVEAWFKKVGSEPAPPFPNPFDKGYVPRWGRLGINIERPVRHPPSIEDFGLEEGFFLSTEMIKRIQGYPAGWNVEAAENNIGKVVASSFPPMMAKMLGLSIHTALTGTEFDHSRAFRVPLLRARSSRLRPGEFIYYTPRISESYADPNRAFRIREAERRRNLDLPHRRRSSADVAGEVKDSTDERDV